VASLVLQGNQYTLTGVGEITIKTDRESMNWQESLQESDTGWEDMGNPNQYFQVYRLNKRGH